MNQYFDQQQSIEITKLAYLAVGCQVLTEDEADALFTIGLKNAYDGARASGRVPQSGDLSLFMAKSEGIAAATDYGACDSFSMTQIRWPLFVSKHNRPKQSWQDWAKRIMESKINKLPF